MSLSDIFLMYLIISVSECYLLKRSFFIQSEDLTISLLKLASSSSESFDIDLPESAKTSSAMSSEVVASSIEILIKLSSNQLNLLQLDQRQEKKLK